MNRQYLGVTVTKDNYRKILDGENGRYLLNFHSKHLSSYLKGHDSFRYGYITSKNGDSYPDYHKVEQKITIITLDENNQEVINTFSSQAKMNDFLRKK